MTTKIVAPIRTLTVPNEDMIEPGFTELAHHSRVYTTFVDHRGQLLSGYFVRSGLNATTGRVVVTAARPAESLPQRDILNSGSVPIDGTTDFEAFADSELALKYLGQTWCSERADTGTCEHGDDCEFDS